MEQEEVQLHFDLQVDPVSQEYLSSAAKWAKFLAIIGFILTGFLVIFGIITIAALSGLSGQFSNSSFAAMGTGFVVLFYVVMAALVFIPALFMYSFASRTQYAIASMDQQHLHESFASLKSYFKFLGIGTICVMALYFIMIIATIAGPAFSSFR